jgi:hypothetical protein
VQLNLVAGDDDETATTADSSDDVSPTPAPWEELSVDTPPDFSLEEPSRVSTKLDTAPPEPLERVAPPEVAPPAPPPVEIKPTPLDVTPPREAPATAVAATPIEAPDVRRQEVIEPLAPAPAGPARVSTNPAREEQAELRGPDAAAQLQQLTEMLTNANLAEAIAATSDRTPASKNDPRAEDAGDAVVLQGANAHAIVHRQLSQRVPKRVADGEPVPELYRLRVAPDRKRLARRLGATKQSDEVVEAALRWLAANQDEDGRWRAKQFGAGEERKVLGQDRQGAGADADTGITALALLSLLGAGHSHLEGPYRESAQRGLEFLCRSQKEDGSLAGEAKLFAMMYCHGMASLALGEAYAMTGDHRLAPFVKKAAEFTIRSQHATTGGWRYLPGDPGDMSQFGWQVMALKSAELGGIAMPVKTRQGMQRFLHNNTSGKHKGLASYRAGERSSRTMTAEAFACRAFLNEDRSPELTSEAAAFVLEDLPRTGQADFYYWYYGSLALFPLQDERWQKWNGALQEQLAERQIKSGELTGSFPTDEVWSGYGGRVYTTAMAALCLEVYYRYLPVYGEPE